MNDTIRLENQNVRFYLKAPANSPIWGNAYDIEMWLKAWHENRCPIMPKEKVIEILEKEDQARYRNSVMRKRAEVKA